MGNPTIEELERKATGIRASQNTQHAVVEKEVSGKITITAAQIDYSVMGESYFENLLNQLLKKKDSRNLDYLLQEVLTRRAERIHVVMGVLNSKGTKYSKAKKTIYGLMQKLQSPFAFETRAKNLKLELS